MTQWDYIVIGAGSAGCTLVNELATALPDARILVLEAGGSDTSPFLRLQAGAFRACLSHDWEYWSEPDPSRHGTYERWWKGRVLGGSSSINSTIFVRGAASDFDRWAAQMGPTNHGWSAADVMPLFKELEHSDQEGESRGHHGRLHVRTTRYPHAATKAFVAAAQAAGYPFNPDYNDADQEGVAFAQLTQRRGGWRCSAADAFLKPNLRKPNVHLILNALVHRIVVEDGSVRAVCFEENGLVRRETAGHVVICAGAINSPKLLMLSGIGDPKQLEEHGINVLIPLPGVGKNLRDHPLTKMVFRMRIQTNNLTGGIAQKLGIAGRFLANREGPVANVFESLAFLKSAPEEPVADLQLHFVSLGYVATPESTLELAPYPAVLIYLNRSHPLSTGEVRLRSADPNAPPEIHCRLLGDPADLQTLTRGVLLTRKIMASEPIASMVVKEIEPGPTLDSPGAISDYLRTHTTTGNHTAGTCRMGTDALSVVSPDLKVRGVENLWVADASIMPSLISGNTNATCMMIGKKLGKHLASLNQSSRQRESVRTEVAAG